MIYSAVFRIPQLGDIVRIVNGSHVLGDEPFIVTQEKLHVIRDFQLLWEWV